MTVSDFRRFFVLLCTALLLAACTADQQWWREDDAEREPWRKPEVISVLAQSTADLIAAQELPGSGLISVLVSRDPELASLALETAGELKKRGYAVQCVLPPEQRQKGDAEQVPEMAWDGTPMAVNVQPFAGSGFVQLSVIFGKSRYAAVFGTEDSRVTMGSPWNRMITGSSLIE